MSVNNGHMAGERRFEKVTGQFSGQEYLRRAIKTTRPIGSEVRESVLPDSATRVDADKIRGKLYRHDGD